MGFAVKVTRQEVQEAAGGDPWDWGSFLWGFAAGGIVVTLLGGVVVYFAWPYVLALMKTVPFFRGVVEEAKAVGVL